MKLYIKNRTDLSLTKPIDRFAKWYLSEKGVRFLTGLHKDGGYSWRLLGDVKDEIKTWLIMKADTKQADKKRWGAFFKNWLLKKGKRENPYITAQMEDEHSELKREIAQMSRRISSEEKN